MMFGSLPRQQARLDSFAVGGGKDIAWSHGLAIDHVLTAGDDKVHLPCDTDDIAGLLAGHRKSTALGMLVSMPVRVELQNQQFGNLRARQLTLTRRPHLDALWLDVCEGARCAKHRRAATHVLQNSNAETVCRA